MGLKAAHRAQGYGAGAPAVDPRGGAPQGLLPAPTGQGMAAPASGGYGATVSVAGGQLQGAAAACPLFRARVSL